jgi:hypothetical protein
MKLTECVSSEYEQCQVFFVAECAAPAGRADLAGTLFILALLGGSGAKAAGVAQTTAQLQTFVTIFLSIFIEAVPFLLAGSIVSGLIDVFVNPDALYRFVPKNPLLASLAGGSLGLLFPVCECGVVPVTRRLYQKGAACFNGDCLSAGRAGYQPDCDWSVLTPRLAGGQYCGVVLS